MRLKISAANAVPLTTVKGPYDLTWKLPGFSHEHLLATGRVGRVSGSRG